MKLGLRGEAEDCGVLVPKGVQREGGGCAGCSGAQVAPERWSSHYAAAEAGKLKSKGTCVWGSVRH